MFQRTSFKTDISIRRTLLSVPKSVRLKRFYCDWNGNRKSYPLGTPLEISREQRKNDSFLWFWLWWLFVTTRGHRNEIFVLLNTFCLLTSWPPSPSTLTDTRYFTPNNDFFIINLHILIDKWFLYATHWGCSLNFTKRQFFAVIDMWKNASKVGHTSIKN